MTEGGLRRRLFKRLIEGPEQLGTGAPAVTNHDRPGNQLGNGFSADKLMDRQPVLNPLFHLLILKGGGKRLGPHQLLRPGAGLFERGRQSSRAAS